jgi:hypothetical protein
MRQDLTTDTVNRYIEASPEALYELIADVTRTPEITPDIVRVEWLDGATGPAVGARFKAINYAGKGPKWSNKPVITVLEPNRDIAWERTEPGGGTIEWRYRFEPEGSGTRITESYRVVKPLSRFGWFLIGTVFGLKDRQTDLHNSMVRTLDRLAEMTEGARESAAS